VTVGDFVLAYTLDWANEVRLLEGFPNLQKYLARMYARPNAPLRIAAAFDSINMELNQTLGGRPG
jgi:glutathione S-transferase